MYRHFTVFLWRKCHQSVVRVSIPAYGLTNMAIQSLSVEKDQPEKEPLRRHSPASSEIDVDRFVSRPTSMVGCTRCVDPQTAAEYPPR